MEADWKLLRLQNLALDAAGLLIAAYEELVSGEDSDPDKILPAIQVSLHILGNTSAQFSQERRTKALSRLSPDLNSLVEDKDFSKAVPLLFSLGFLSLPLRRGNTPVVSSFERPRSHWRSRELQLRLQNLQD